MNAAIMGHDFGRPIDVSDALRRAGRYVSRALFAAPRVAHASACPQCGQSGGHAAWCGWTITGGSRR